MSTTKDRSTVEAGYTQMRTRLDATAPTYLMLIDRLIGLDETPCDCRSNFHQGERDAVTDEMARREGAWFAAEDTTPDPETYLGAGATTMEAAVR